MTILQILKKIKKLKAPELKELAIKLNIAEVHKPNLTESFLDLEEALTHCMFHYQGNMYESLGYDICPCRCFCMNCEMIPEDTVKIRMQQIGENMTEKNVMLEFLEQHPNFTLKLEDCNGKE